ncbi:MAG TPA: N-acetylmuramoyl-L-alanine amidase [Gammaproteobacteria bacterium]|nr:N-acetylmuramoyl-L-alanine amidase [Gammaproteobacteria bacterium]
MGARYLAAWLLLIPALCLAGPIQVKGVRLWAAPDSTRVVFDVSGPVSHDLFVLHHPDRVVIDLSDTHLDTSVSGLDFSKGLVKDIRTAPRHHSDLRVVLDLRGAAHPKSFVLPPKGPYGHRLVVDLDDVAAQKAEAAQAREIRKRRLNPAKPREVVVCIDPGHGGEDPGAHGIHGTLEKNVTLAIARRLRRLVARQPGMRPVMTRTGDYYVGLRKRMEIARRHKADLFISIHADSFRNHHVRGSSVYVLSRHGASSEMARILARQENAADQVGGVDLSDKDHLLKTVLLDLSQSATIEASMTAARDVLHQLDRVGEIHKSHVQRAAFVVLKSPDVPSMLVETAFISNPREERELRSHRHQQALARAIMGGIRAYFDKYPPPGTILAQRKHVIRRGDTLSALAQRYQVSLHRLKVANGLSSDQLQVGDVLVIPPSGG